MCATEHWVPRAGILIASCCFSLSQVSWAKPHDEAPKGTTKISFYDDEGASALRKVRR